MANASIISAVTRRLEGKVALIIGGVCGIGAKLFSQHGAKLAIDDVQDELGHNVVKSIGSSHSTYIHCNVINEDHVKTAVNNTVSTYIKLNIMFNNARIIDPQKSQIIFNDKSDFERVMSVNVTRVFLCMKHAARVMIPTCGGFIISTRSTASRVGGSGPHAYTCLAPELRQFGIRVKCVSPYVIATPLAKGFVGLDDDEEFENASNSMATLKGVTLKVGDIANAALFLTSDEAKYVSGHDLVIDGGFTVVNSATKLFKYQES